MRIDLHTHSIESDGSDTPAQLIIEAAHADLDVVALTDHDTAAGWSAAAEAAGETPGVTLVRGIEFSTTNEKRGQHLLGYNLDPQHADIADILQRASASRVDRIEALLAKLEEIKRPVDREFVFSLAGGIPSRKHVAAGLVNKGYVSTDDEAFAEYLNEDGPAYIQRYRPTIEDAIAAIRAAGGVAVIAHPRDSKRGPGVTEARFEALKKCGLNGIEVDHPAHPAQVRDELRVICSNLGLIATGSSDYHGTRKTDHDLGCNLTSVEAAEALLGSGFIGR